MNPSSATTTETGISTSLGNDVFAPLRDFGAEEALPDAFGILYWLNTVWNIYSIIAFIFSALFIFGLIYAMQRIAQLREEHAAELRAAERAFIQKTEGGQQNTRWQDVQTHIQSHSPNDWRLAIIEADIMLEEALEELGLAGNTIGEMLKSASTNQIRTLDDAWSAHLVRNKIAHTGADFVLTQRLAQETINQYQRVFMELGKV